MKKKMQGCVEHNYNHICPHQSSLACVSLACSMWPCYRSRWPTLLPWQRPGLSSDQTMCISGWNRMWCVCVCVWIWHSQSHNCV